MRGDIALTASAQTLAILHRNALMLVEPELNEKRAKLGSRKRGGAALGVDKSGKIRVPGVEASASRRDLAGKRIGVVHEIASMSPNSQLLEKILAQSDIALEAVTLVSLTPDEVRSAFETNKVDAIFAAPAPQSGLDHDIVTALTNATGAPDCSSRSAKPRRSPSASPRLSRWKSCRAPLEATLPGPRRPWKA